MALNGTGDDSAWESPLSGNRKAPVLLVNETRFANYHRLGTTMRIVTNAPPADGTGAANKFPPHRVQAPRRLPSPPSASAANAETATQENPAAKTSQPSETVASSPSPPQPSAAVPAAPAPPPEPVIPEITLTDARGIPGSPADASASSYSLKVTSRLVDVGIVAYDKKNRPVTDLKASDFEVYDNGQKQEIRSFSQDAAQAATAQEATPVTQSAVLSDEPKPSTNRSANSQTAPAMSLVKRPPPIRTSRFC